MENIGLTWFNHVLHDVCVYIYIYTYSMYNHVYCFPIMAHFMTCFPEKFTSGDILSCPLSTDLLGESVWVGRSIGHVPQNPKFGIPFNGTHLKSNNFRIPGLQTKRRSWQSSTCLPQWYSTCLDQECVFMLFSPCPKIIGCAVPVTCHALASGSELPTKQLGTKSLRRAFDYVLPWTKFDLLLYVYGNITVNWKMWFDSNKMPTTDHCFQIWMSLKHSWKICWAQHDILPSGDGWSCPSK